MRLFVIGTRGSSLALCQAQIVQTKLEERVGARRVTRLPIKAQADQHPERSLAQMSGEGVFVKELEAALLDRRIDLAVHSLKDLPLDQPAGLRVAAVLEREEPRDAFISRTGSAFDALPDGARIGTSSPRRQSQLLHRRKGLACVEIRGNVDTRLRKLDRGEYDAIVLAACGLIRLGLEERITEYLSVAEMLPEPGQGALAVEARVDDAETLELLRNLDDPASRTCVEAERSFLRALGGGCRVPIAAYAACDGAMLTLDGSVTAADGTASVRGRLQGPVTEPVALGKRLADQLTAQGATQLLSGKG